MTEALRKNVPGEQLRSLVERIERIDAEKKGLSEDRAAVMAEAKAAGFNTGGITYCIRVRKMKPRDRQDAETIRDLYLHALGMDQEPPLFRQIAAMARDNAARDELIDAWKKLVPIGGEVIVKSTGKPVRIWRDKGGEAHHEDYSPPEPGVSGNAGAKPAPREKRDVPDCTADEAQALGREAAKQNIAVIDNPFPYGDARRARWDRGWREGSGNDGMGGD
ncbi:MAG TPA: DUF2312 domain-containing protein [Rhizomicrobium sp.]|nr:DUF2312 domain-containing protein [Rhizomicrobium sp.]